jgi:hypothetical protein
MSPHLVWNTALSSERVGSAAAATACQLHSITAASSAAVVLVVLESDAIELFFSRQPFLDCKELDQSSNEH